MYIIYLNFLNYVIYFDYLYISLKSFKELFFSTPKSVKEEKIEINDDSLDDLCCDKQRKMAGDLVTIDTIIDLVRL